MNPSSIVFDTAKIKHLIFRAYRWMNFNTTSSDWQGLAFNSAEMLLKHLINSERNGELEAGVQLLSVYFRSF